MPRLLSALLLSLAIASSASAVTMAWTPVGAEGAPCDVLPEGCYGGVAYSYQIGTYEVTNAQYSEFLNAVARTDTNALYNPAMSAGVGGIGRTGISGSFAYTTIAGRENMPVTYVSLYDALRFANWMTNGQPIGAQSASTTEDGSYTFDGNPFLGEFRNPGGTVFVTTEDEWYKAAYYDAGRSLYLNYPSGLNNRTVCATLPNAVKNRANCGAVAGDLTPVGSYTGSASPMGTFDQGGNAWEWTESDHYTGSSSHRVRGGSFNSDFRNLEVTASEYGNPNENEWSELGFRLTLVPEPGTGLLVITGLVGLASWRRGRA